MVDDNQEGPSGQEGQQGQESEAEREVRQLSESIARRLSEHLLRGPVTTIQGEKSMGLGTYLDRALALSWDGVSRRQVDFAALDDSAPDMTDLAQLEEQAPPAPATPRYDVVMRARFSLPKEQPAPDPDDFDAPIPPVIESDAVFDPSTGDGVSVTLYDRVNKRVVDMGVLFLPPLPSTGAVEARALLGLGFGQEIEQPPAVPLDTFIGGRLRVFHTTPATDTSQALTDLHILEQALTHGGYNASETQGAAFSKGQKDSLLKDPAKMQDLDTTDEKRAANAQNIANYAPSINAMVRSTTKAIPSLVSHAVASRTSVATMPYPR